VRQEAIGATLAPLFGAFAAQRMANEGFGDFCARLGQEATRALLAPSERAA
jgi:sulfite reductase (ferredoxin)